MPKTYTIVVDDAQRIELIDALKLSPMSDHSDAVRALIDMLDDMPRADSSYEIHDFTA